MQIEPSSPTQFYENNYFITLPNYMFTEFIIVLLLENTYTRN